MRLNFSYEIYYRPFLKPLITNHGIWKIREGIIIQLQSDIGEIGRGEIAPLPWFGSETLTEAILFCESLPNIITPELIDNIPNNLPCCQFALESALEELDDPAVTLDSLCYSGLLPAGKLALSTVIDLLAKGYKTFKWKINVLSLKEELEILSNLWAVLPSDAKLRLDANGGLSWESANQWLKICDEGKIEFLEQPLPFDQLDELFKLQDQYQTAIALDESVANLTQLKNCYERGWSGVFVIKPCIMGSIRQLREFCQNKNLDLVFSSALETEIGKKTAIKLAHQLSNRDRAIGFGTDVYFDK